MSTDIYKGHKNLADMTITHLGTWYRVLEKAEVASEDDADRSFFAHERKALAEIKAACESDLAAGKDDMVLVEKLRTQYGNFGEFKQYPRTDWHHEVINDNTSRGYWEWVAAELEANRAIRSIRETSPQP